MGQSQLRHEEGPHSPGSKGEPWGRRGLHPRLSCEHECETSWEQGTAKE